MYIISPYKKQYKANLHSHSSLSDGTLTPEELKELYKAHGYQVLAITDHEYPHSHAHMTDSDFLMLTGYECYIRPNPEGKYNQYAPEVHLNLFARDPRNKTMICYNKAYCRYLPEALHENLAKAGSQRTREYSREYVNEYIKTATENGYLVAYNHPVWSMETEEDILSYEGYFSMEMTNYNSYVGNQLEHNGTLYDKMLHAGKHVFCHGVDDNHNRFPVGEPACDSFGGFTMILADELSYDSIFGAMERGEMYSSMGPVFKEVSINDGIVHIECSEVTCVHVFTGSKRPKAVYASDGGTLTCVDVPLDPTAKYIRVSIRDKEGKWADTRGFFPDEYQK